MSHRPKRRAGFGGANQPRMTAEEYEELIGRHKHIEHKALNSEIAKELSSLIGNRPSRTIVNNDQLYPPQPPPLPIEANRTKNLTFKRSTPWPCYSTIQRAAHMYFNSRFPIDTVTKFLQTNNIPQIQIKQANDIYKLMDESEKYWRKVSHLGSTYTQRYDNKTRQYALTNATWALQIGMTLHEFHLDHIVDIVYKKPLWSSDYDIQWEKEQADRRAHMKAPEQKYNNFSYDDTNTTASYEEEYETTDSERQVIRQEDINGMSKEELQRIQQAAMQEHSGLSCHVQEEQGLDDIFAFNNLFQNVKGRDGKPVVLDANFETDLMEEKTQFDGRGNEDLEKLYKKYPELDKGLVRQTYFQEDENVNLTIFALDNRENDSNAFFMHQAQGK